jgi:hypothetical protein
MTCELKTSYLRYIPWSPFSSQQLNLSLPK